MIEKKDINLREMIMTWSLKFYLCGFSNVYVKQS